jgi:hypothetical protein
MCFAGYAVFAKSGHLLLAYGWQHNSLLKSLIVDGTTTIPVYTVLEVISFTFTHKKLSFDLCYVGC